MQPERSLTSSQKSAISPYPEHSIFKLKLQCFCYLLLSEGDIIDKTWLETELLICIIYENILYQNIDKTINDKNKLRDELLNSLIIVIFLINPVKNMCVYWSDFSKSLYSFLRHDNDS